MTTSDITTAARRIAREHNKCGPALSGGVLAFDAEGRGGAWYSHTIPGSLCFPVLYRRVTQREVQDWLDAEREAEREWVDAEREER